MESISQTSRLIIIGGAPRSGTTLLQNMLDCHTEILGGPEFLHLKDIIKLRSQLYSSLDRNWINLICSYEDVDARIREMIESFLIRFADRQGTNRLSEKTPESVLVFTELAEVLPETLFIHMVRDPRAIVASLLEVANKFRSKKQEPPAFTQNIHSAIKYTKQCLDSGFRAAEKFPERILNVRYEDLTSQPETESRKICTFLELEWQAQLCSPAGQTHLGEQAITVQSDELWYDKASYNRNPSTDSLTRWKHSLTAAQQLAIAKAFSADKNLERLGYKITIDDLSAAQRFTATVTNSIGGIRQSLPKVIRRLSKA